MPESNGWQQRARSRFRRRLVIWALLVLGLCGVGGITLFLLLTPAAPVPHPARAPVPPQGTTPSERPQPTMRFTDVTTAAGIEFTHVAGAAGARWYPETIGAGVGFFDYDGDDWPDVLLVNGRPWTAPPPRAEQPTLRLYRNRGDGTFEDVTRRAGMAVPLYGMGLASADYDNDGDRDVLVTGYLRNLFFINNGDGTFHEAARQVGLRDGLWGGGAAFFDYDRDGDLDLVISNYVTWTPELEAGLDCTYGTPRKDYCSVRYFKGEGLTLYRNRGDGTFEDVTQRAGVASEGTRAFAPAIIDFNEDQWPDILVSSDGTPSLLFKNQQDGTFVEVGVQSGIVLDEGGSAYAGMGVDAAYITNDEQLCIAIGNFAGEPTTLHCRVRQGTSYYPELYAEVSSWAGIGRPTLRYVTFGMFFFDVDLDGFEDLFMVNGHVVDEARLRHAPRAQPPQLFRNLGNGKFAEVMAPAGSGLDQRLIGRGAAYADYDRDGDLDIVISQNQGPAVLLRNDTRPQGRYLRVRLQGTSSNRDGIGAEVRVHTDAGILRQTLRTGRSYYSQNEFALTFGLGQMQTVPRVEIHWPSGRLEVYPQVPADTTLHAVEGSQTAAKVARGAREETTTGHRHKGEEPAFPTASTSNEFLALTHTGIEAYHAGQYAEAVRAFEAARKVQPTDPLSYRYLADLYWRLGQPKQVREIVQNLATVVPDVYFFDRLGGGFEEAGQAEVARLAYQEAIRLDPQFPSAHYNLGRLWLQQGELKRGMAEVKRALQLYPDFAQAHETLGMAYTEQGQLDKATAHLERALAIQPESATARNHLARIYLAQGQLDRAIGHFQELVRYHPELAEARHNLAVAYARQGRRDEALEQFRAAVRLQPDFHAARVDMAGVLLEAHRPLEAIAALQTVLATAAQDSDTGSAVDFTAVRFRLGIAYLMAEQVDEAMTLFRTVVQEQPAHAGAHSYLGRLYYARGQFERAWHHARQAEALGAPVADLITALQRVSVEPR
jgi:tetratricopeptide (TPR) repeat protein